MFSALLISPTPERSLVIKTAAQDSGRLLLCRIIEEYPQGFTVARLLHALAPEIVLLDLHERQAALGCARAIREYSPKTPVVGFLDAPPAAPGGDLGGLDAVLAFLSEPAVVAKCVDSVLHQSLCERKENLLVFLPAKGGSGATTLAWNTAAALAETAGKRPLLIETDYRCGALSFMLDQKPEGSIQEVLRTGNEMDGLRFTSQITECDGVALLLSDRTPPNPEPGWESYTRLIDVATARYDPVLFDLPESFPPEMCEITRRAGKVILVTTPDVVALKLASCKCAELLTTGVEERRLQVVLNRREENDLGEREIEGVLHRTVLHSLPADNRSTRAALLRGESIPAKTDLGRGLQKLAAKLMSEAQPAADKAPGGLRSALRFAPWRQ